MNKRGERRALTAERQHPLALWPRFVRAEATLRRSRAPHRHERGRRCNGREDGSALSDWPFCP